MSGLCSPLLLAHNLKIGLPKPSPLWRDVLFSPHVDTWQKGCRWAEIQPVFCVMVHFMYHIGLVPWYLVRHYSGYFWEGVFIDMINIWISGFWVKQFTLYHVAGPHPTSWDLNATKTDHPEKKFCHPTPFVLVTTTLPRLQPSSQTYQILDSPGLYSCVSQFLISICVCVCVCVCVQVSIHTPIRYVCAQSCPTLCDPMNCSPPGSSIHGILQARLLEWVTISSSIGSSQPRGSSPHLLCLLHWQADSLPLSYLGS